MRLMQVRDDIKSSIVEEMKKISDRLTSGSAQDYAAYRQQVGRIQGLKDAFDCVDEVFNKLLDDKDGD